MPATGHCQKMHLLDVVHGVRHVRPEGHLLPLRIQLLHLLRADLRLQHTTSELCHCQLHNKCPSPVSTAACEQECSPECSSCLHCYACNWGRPLQEALLGWPADS